MIELGMYSEIRELNEVIASLLALLRIEPKGALKTLMSSIDKFFDSRPSTMISFA